MTKPRKLTEQELDALDSASEGMDYMVCEDAAARLRYVEQRLEQAEDLLRECAGDYNHPRFTDRHRMGPRLSAFLAESDDD